MIIPVKCFTCNCLLGSKYIKYLELKDKMSAKEIFKLLKVRRYCCKTVMLTHVDMIDVLNMDQ